MPRIAIIGRQNVGKSTLFNALIGKRRAIIYNEPGSTRDIINHPLPWGEGSWELFDFPGFEQLKKVKLNELAKLAITKAVRTLNDYHLLLWVVSRKGLSEYEYMLHEQLRRMEKAYWLVVNFVDDPSLEAECSEMHGVGVKETFFVSALNQRNLEVLVDKIKSYFSANPREDEQGKQDEIKKPSFAIVGKPNAGKSTFYNLLLKKEKALVSAVPGTTRDSLESEFLFHKQAFQIIDTAGLRKNKHALGQVERLAELRSFESIQKADVIIFLIDPQEGFDRQNKDIMGAAHELRKPMLIAVNKADQLKTKTAVREQLTEDAAELQAMFWKFPVYFVSAMLGDKVMKVIKAGMRLYEKARVKYPTPMLNRLIQDVKNEPILANHKIKPLYITQPGRNPEFILFINRKSVPPAIRKFLTRKIQAYLGITDLPAELHIRKSPPGKA